MTREQGDVLKHMITEVANDVQEKQIDHYLVGYAPAYPQAYPTDARQQFHYLTDLTVRSKAALTSLGVEFVALPASSEMRL